MERKVFAVVAISTEYMDFDIETYNTFDRAYQAFNSKIGEFFIENLLFSGERDKETCCYDINMLGEEFNHIEITDGRANIFENWLRPSYEDFINKHEGEIYVGFNTPNSYTFLLKEVSQE